MKRFSMIITIVFICSLFLLSLGEPLIYDNQDPIYKAFSNVDFHIRKEPNEESKRLGKVTKNETLLVYEYDEQWCQVKYKDTQGYCKTRWLHIYRSLQPGKTSVPGFPFQTGIAKVLVPNHISVAGYEGNSLLEGVFISIHQWTSKDAMVHMMRDTTSIPISYLEYIPFASWDIAKNGELIGGFTTYYNEKTGGKLSTNRQWNIELACQLVDGTLVKTGEIFSFNALCAPYKKSKGYEIAPIIGSDGKGYGGGVCQLSTTIYNAVLGLPLQIEKWRIHRASGVSYVPRGFDAAVGQYGDFAFQNTLPYNIKLETLSQNGALTVLIYRSDFD